VLICWVVVKSVLITSKAQCQQRDLSLQDQDTENSRKQSTDLPLGFTHANIPPITSIALPIGTSVVPLRSISEAPYVFDGDLALNKESVPSSFLHATAAAVEGPYHFGPYSLSPRWPPLAKSQPLLQLFR
jgi:hypothetical protein